MHRRDATRWDRQADLVKRSSGAVADAAFLRRQFTADLDVVQDARCAVRMLRKRPIVSALAVVVLALGLGGTITVFSTIDALLLRRLPSRGLGSRRDRVADRGDAHRRTARCGVGGVSRLARPDEIVRLVRRRLGFGFDYFDGPEPVQLRRGARDRRLQKRSACNRCAAACSAPRNTSKGDRTSCCSVMRRGSDDSVATRRWSAERSGSTIGRSWSRACFHPRSDLTCCGVRPIPSAGGWLRWKSSGHQGPPGLRAAGPAGPLQGVVGRLAPGVPFEQAQADLATISRHLATEYPQTMASMTAVIEPLRE